MPRGRRRAAVGADAIEQELAALKQRQAELRIQLRRLKSSATDISKLQEKLESQFATAKWTVQQIHAIQPDWDDVGFYGSVSAKQPKPRGRRPRAAAGTEPD